MLKKNYSIFILFSHLSLFSAFTDSLASDISWQELAPLPAKVDHHTTFIHEGAIGPYLYFYGGIEAVNEAPNSIFKGLNRAPILADGTLGTWENLVSSIPGFTMHAQAQTATHVYQIGGIVFDESTAAFAGNPNILIIDLVTGLLSTGPKVPYLNMHATAIVRQGNLYLIGGAGSQHLTLNRVMVAKIGADGNLGAWQDAKPLPKGRSHHTALLINERIYLFAGLNDHNQSDSSILASVHDSTGALIDWEQVGSMPVVPWTASGVLHHDSVYLIGGGYNENPPDAPMSEKVLKGKLAADGTVNSWEELTNTLPLPRAHVHQTPVYNGKIYSIGGRDHTLSSIDKVFVGSFFDAI